MKRRSNIFGGLVLVFLLPGCFLFSQVNQSDTSRIQLNEITIRGSRIPESANRTSRMAVIITKKLISTSPSKELADILRYLPDLDVRQRGPVGIQADISLRGGSFDQNAILLNGINLNDPQTGHFMLDIPVPVSLIRQIEVLPGSDVKSMGAGALAGSVNIVTGKPERSALHAKIAGGRWGYGEIAAEGTVVKKNFWQQAGISWQQSSGYTTNTDFTKLIGFTEAGYHKGRFEIDLMAGFLTKAFGANNFYTAKYPNQYEETGTGMAALTLLRTGKVNIRQSFYYRTHADVFHLFRSDPPTWYTAPNYHLSQIAGSKTDAWFTSGVGRTALGAEFRSESVWSTVLGELSNSPKQALFLDSILYTRNAGRFHSSLTLEHGLSTGPVSWKGSIVLHYAAGSKDYLNLYPGLDIGMTVTPWMRVFATVNRGFRLPTFTELYYKSPTNVGNPDLQPESAWHSEVGAQITAGNLMGRIGGFYRFAPQSIDWVRLPAETVWHTENLGQIQTSGIETSLSYSFGSGKNGLIALDRFDLGYRHYFQHHSSSEYFSQYILDFLIWKITTGVRLVIFKNVFLSLQMTAQDRAGGYTSLNEAGAMVEKEYKPFWLMDGKIAWKVHSFTCFAECSNLFDQSYFDFVSIPQPGVWLRLGLELDLLSRK